MPLASTTIRAAIGPVIVVTPRGIPWRVSKPVTPHGCRSATPASHAQDRNKASKSARRTWNPLHGPLASPPEQACPGNVRPPRSSPSGRPVLELPFAG
jgi:hypothetical protein